MTRYNNLTRKESVAILRVAGETAMAAGEEAERVLGAVADYVEGTADDMGREAIQEIAMAYVAGYMDGHSGKVTGSPRVYRALTDAELRR